MSPTSQTPPAFREGDIDVPRALATYAVDYPPGHRVATHRHARHQFVHAVAGVMTVSAAGTRWLVPPQFGVWVPAGVAHALTMHGRVRLRTLYVDPPARRDLPGACSVRAVSPLLRELILRAVALPRLYDVGGPPGRLVAVLLDEVVASPPAALDLPWPLDARAAGVAAALRAAPDDRRSLAEWGRQVGAGERTLARLFARETGLGFRAWRRRLRLQHALRRLAEGGAVTAVALDCGYDSVSAFVAAFRRELGRSPGRYVAAAGGTVQRRLAAQTSGPSSRASKG